MATGYYRLISPAMNAQAVCTLFEAESDIDACTVAGITGEADTDPIIGDDAVWEGTLTIDATGGTFDIGDIDGTDTEAGVAEDVNSATLQAALRALTTYGATLTVTGDGPHVIVLAQDDPELLTDPDSLTGGAQGWATVVNTSEFVDTVTIDATGGTYEIGILGDTSPTVAFDDNSAALQVILRALTGLGAQLTVTGDDPHVITRVDEEATPIIAVGTNLTGGEGLATLATTQSAHDDSEILVFPNQVIFKVTGQTIAAIEAAAAALIAAEDDAGDSNAGANVELASGYPAVAI